MSVIRNTTNIRNDIFKIPNLLRFYMLLAFPLILYFIISSNGRLFAIFLIINLVTEIVDGYIARKFRQEIEFCSRLDSVADDLIYVLSFIGLFVFKWENISRYQVSFFIFIGFLISTIILNLIRFRKLPSFHLYTTKISGYIRGTFSPVFSLSALSAHCTTLWYYGVYSAL